MSKKFASTPEPVSFQIQTSLIQQGFQALLLTAALLGFTSLFYPVSIRLAVVSLWGFFAVFFIVYRYRQPFETEIYRRGRQWFIVRKGTDLPIYLEQITMNRWWLIVRYSLQNQSAAPTQHFLVLLNDSGDKVALRQLRRCLKSEET